MPTYFFSEDIFVLWYIRIVQEVLAFIFIVSAFLSSSVDFFQQNALSVLIPGVGRVGVKDLQYEYLEVSKLQSWASLVTQMVKNLPAVQETQVQSLDWEGPIMVPRILKCNSVCYIKYNSDRWVLSFPF